MKKKIITLVLSTLLILTIATLHAQNNNGIKRRSETINYSKYIGKTVKYFLSDFNLPTKDTIGIREYFGVIGFILKLDSTKYLYIYPKIVNDSTNQNRKMEDSFSLEYFHQYNIKSILVRNNGKTVKIYGKYNGRLKE